ncbi:BURP domain protein USPL1-like [Cucurbita pepo subsp. pepo]|uniref:BURP domain protein USPL1-like n=1 Tax=Cucurbita pepo subsp. pepo TaxID=3664 RepID=UPI000C9D9A81|nr:BURP domain protein USPL1-like [Cucurbita pepo subsp. pepo]
MGGTTMTSCFLLIPLLLLVMFGEARQGFSEIEEKNKQIELNDHIEATIKAKPIIKMVTKMANDHNSHDAHSSSSHMDHINPLLIVFFTINDLKQGKKLPIYFPKRDPSKSPPLLPKEQADPIPFSLKKLPQILSYFSYPSNSPQAQAVKETLEQCELKPIKGETKFCATSMESMVNFVRTAFGPKTHYEVLTTSHLTKSNVHLQNYTFIEAPEEIAAPRLVACHTMPYAYAVYYCHYQKGDNNVLKIQLEGENGDRVEALAICHMDTSQWSPSHPSFQVLKIQPGTIPVCHFFPADDFVWIPVPTSNSELY